MIEEVERFSTGPYTLNTESLDLLRYNSKQYKDDLYRTLTDKYSDSNIDVIVATLTQAKHFIAEYDLFPDTPKIYVVSSPDLDDYMNNAVLFGFEFDKNVEHLLELMPDTKTVYVVSGASVLDKSFEGSFRTKTEYLKDRVNFEFLSGVELDELYRKASSLPNHSVMYVLPYTQTPSEDAVYGKTVAKTLAATSNRPVFTFMDLFAINTNTFGGRVMSTSSLASHAAELAWKIINDGHDQSVRNIRVPEHQYIYDWRQFEKWNIDESKLPAGSIIQYKQFNAFEEYGKYILMGIFLILIQSTLIVALLVNRRVRRIAQEALLESQRLLLSAYDTVTDAIMITRLSDNVIVDVNDGFLKTTGYSKDEVIGKTPLALQLWVVPELRDDFISKLKSAGIVRNFEFQFRLKDGSSITGLLSSSVTHFNGEDHMFSFVRDISDRKIAEKELIESRESLKTLVEFTEAVHWVFDLSLGKFTYVSPQTQKMTGYAPDEWTDLDSWSDMIHGEDRDWAVNFCLMQTQDNKDHDFSYRIITRQGAVKWLRDIVKVISEDNRPVKLIGVMLDITDIKQSEIELNRSLKLLDATGAIAKVGGWELEAKTLKPFFTKEVYRIYEIPEGEPPPVEKGMDYYDPHDRPKVAEAVRKALEEGEPYDLELRFISGKGTRKWVRVLCTPVITDGEVEKLTGTMQDITVVKQTEEALKLSEAFLKRAQEIGHVGSWHLDIEKNILSWSDEEYRIFGHTTQSFGSTYEAFLEAVHPDDREMVNRTYTEAITSNTPYECVHRVLRPDGIVRTVLERSEDIVNEKGKAIHSYGITLDITELKENEDKLAKSLREKEVLLKEVHHRVKNNMAVISSLLALQSGYIDDRKYLDMFNESQSRIRSMALVHEKLYQSDDFANINARDYIETLAQNVKMTFAAEGEIKCTGDARHVILDIDVMIPCGLIINEILTNSFKYAFDGIGNPEITISLEKAGEERAVLTIADNGKGFPEGFGIEKTKGLGLKLVKILANQIKGRLEVKSDQGVEFTLTFPTRIEYARHLPDNG